MAMFAPRLDDSIYPMLEARAQTACGAARIFHSLTADFRETAAHRRMLEQLEEQADALTRPIVYKVNVQRITPLDKEDVLALIQRLDDITSAITDAMRCIALYRLPQSRPDLDALGGLLVAITREIDAMVGSLHIGFRREILCCFISGILALEAQEHKRLRQSMALLAADLSYDDGLHTQWKDLYERIELAAELCGKLAGFIESLIEKYT